jgi:magnesium-transporting ATPase (P-type)
LGVIDKRTVLRKIREISFSSEAKYMEIVYQAEGLSSPTTTTLSAANMSIKHTGSSNSLNGYHSSSEELRYLKGALEVILPMCVSCVGNSSGETVPLTAAAVERVQQHSLEMANDGLR